MGDISYKRDVPSADKMKLSVHLPASTPPTILSGNFLVRLVVMKGEAQATPIRARRMMTFMIESEFGVWVLSICESSFQVAG